VIYIGGLNKNAWQDCESTDRREYELPFGQNRLIEELLAANPNVVIANIAGNAYEMPWAKDVPAILHTSYLGTMGGATIADVLAGNVNPSGKLPYSIPVRLEDCGANSFGEISYPGVESDVADVVAIPGSVIEGGRQPQQKYMEDILVGYRWHDTKKIPALFPFGYGLSYTDFEYGKPTATARTLDGNGEIEIEVPVTNTGSREGSETVQLYISDLKSSLPRPAKELKGFSKVKLAPGETKRVKFTVTPDALKYFDDRKHEWVVEPGRFKAHIGASSTDIRHTVDFEYK
ncbi:MAG: glycoside hydrolase family 3 C-terminal domain-containing protein, partial [Muribaculaceae bacterium]|nr:glycoside hydrolase family 3 C-terminal domain-containing protein [Muribaculaceae bacterium]